MKAVILAGGLGTRLSEETNLRPKPMVEIGPRPILWHIMKIYHFYGVNDFIICCGYKGDVIKEYFLNYKNYISDITIDFRDNSVTTIQNQAEPWKVTLLDTGEDTKTGGRLKRVKSYVEKDEMFCFTYGDGVADVNIKSLIEFHQAHKKIATLTAAYPSGRFGALQIDSGSVQKFSEKPRGDGAMVNGGFFVLSPAVFSMIEGDNTVWEEAPLATLASRGELMAYEHTGFWHPMDTLRDKTILNKLWSEDAAPWKIWD